MSLQRVKNKIQHEHLAHVKVTLQTLLAEQLIPLRKSSQCFFPRKYEVGPTVAPHITHFDVELICSENRGKLFTAKTAH